MQVSCPACKKTLQSKHDLSGKTVKCPCGHAFTAPRAAAATAAATAKATAASPAASNSSAAPSKITVQCSCGKTLQAPAAAAGKAVKCPCGQVVKVPAGAAAKPVATAKPVAVAKPMAAAASVAAFAQGAAPVQARRAPAAAAVSTAPDPFGDISDDEWKNMVQSHAPKQVDTSKPKEKSAAAKMLEQARQETGVGDSLAMESALGFLNKTRGILVGIGLLVLVAVAVDYWLSMSELEALAAGGEEPEMIDFIKRLVMVFCGIGAGIAVAFISAGFLVSMFPLTCTISALVLYTLLELARLILNPFMLLSIRGWIFRISIYGGLIQGVNNAAYYRHLKAEEKAARKQKGR